ncbi:MAG: hypothetical protein E7253_06065 [Lachnospiraceae bacterium]|nr:hypothetical protein [Lachnospiraceae bacterium]
MESKVKKINHVLISLLILAQPFIIMFQANIVRDVQFLGLSVFEGFNILLSVVSLCLTIYTYNNKRMFLKYVPYVVILAAYILAHGYNIYQFNNSVYEAQSPSFLVETYYIFRTFFVPLLLMFNVYYSGIEKEKIIGILEKMLFVVVSVMVATNLFKVAFINYSEDMVRASYSIFDWFTFENTREYAYYDLTTKGWFLSGNQMSSILFMTLLVSMYRLYKKRDVFHYGLVVLQMLAMCMLGTKVANVGCLLIVALFILLWCLFACLKQHKKGIVFSVILLLILSAVLPFSPIGYKYRFHFEHEEESDGESGLILDAAIAESSELEELDEEIKVFYENLVHDSIIFKKLEADKLTNEEKEFVREYMITYGSYFGISTFIIENYDDLDHSEFWVRYIQTTPNNDYRVLKTMILKDIYNNNDNPLDRYLGMGYTTNYIYTEADYTYQIYLYGIVGLLLFVGPYFWTLLYVIYKGLRNFKKMFTLESATYFIAPCIGLVVAKMSGHVLERTYPLLVIALLTGILLIHTRKTTCEKN